MKKQQFNITPELLDHLEEKLRLTPDMLKADEWERAMLAGKRELLEYLRSLK